MCQSLMHESARCVFPVTSLDAVHLKSKWICLHYPAAMSIISRNEDCQGWVYFLAKLKEAYPVLAEEHPVSSGSIALALDRGKRSVKAVLAIFPNSPATNCDVHVQRNAWTKLGQVAAEDIIWIAQTFSTWLEENWLLKAEKSALELSTN